MMNNTTKRITLAALALGGIALTSASAQNPNFAYGDLVLAFQSTGGQGSGSYLFANIGPAGLIRDYTQNTQLLSGSLSGLASQLGLTFGSNWYDRTDLFVAVAGVQSNDEFNGFFQYNDPDVTPYVGVPRQSVGTVGLAGSFAPFFNPAGTQQVANGITAGQFYYESSFTGSIAVIPKSGNFNDWDDQNPIANGGLQGNAFDTFSGGIHQAFGAGSTNIGGTNAEAALDLYRIQLFNNIPGQEGFGEATNVGRYEGTILIDSLGNVSLGNLAAIPEPSLPLLVGGGLLGVMARRRRAALA